ncbi:MAG: alpha/beta hydrolase [Pseudomonadota bacterium]
MPLRQVNAIAGALQGLDGLPPTLDALHPGQAVTIMTHGLRFDPLDDAHDPHTHILSLRPRACWKAVSWPRHLHLDRPGAGLGIAFGWQAVGPVRLVANRALDAGDAMARLIAAIHDRRPDLQINLMAHSLGARVVLRALSQAEEGAVAKVILLAGAEYRTRASEAVDSPAGRRAEVLNVSSGANRLFDALFRLGVTADRVSDWPVAAGLSRRANWTDLHLDTPESRAALSALGLRVQPQNHRICHWSTYLRPGLFPLYRQILDPRRPDRLRELTAALEQAATPPTPSWRRLVSGGDPPHAGPHLEGARP